MLSSVIIINGCCQYSRRDTCVGLESAGLLAPLLEEAHALATTVGSPQVTATGGIVAAVVRSVVAVASPADARTSVKVDQRRPPAKIISTILV